MAVTNVPVATLAQRWATNMGAAGAKMQAGAQALTVAPGQAAARQKAVWIQNVTAAQTRWARNVAAVTLPEWQNDFVTKGIPRVASGAEAAKTKFAATLTKIMTAERQIVASLPARGNTNANIQRAVAFMTAMAQKRGTFTS